MLAIVVTMKQPPEPDDLDRKIERARKRMDAARTDLMAAIWEALNQKRNLTRIGRYAHWSREYIAQIRDGKVG